MAIHDILQAIMSLLSKSVELSPLIKDRDYLEMQVKNI